MTVSGLGPLDGVTVIAATGGWFGPPAPVTLVKTKVLSVAPLSSVTVSVVVQLLTAVNVLAAVDVAVVSCICFAWSYAGFSTHGIESFGNACCVPSECQVC